MSFGWHNPWPFQWGGGQTDDEEIYEAMRRAVGVGGSAKDDGGIDGLWRQVRAGGIATVESFVERAAFQAFPQTATDHIPLFEDYLGIVPRDDESDEERRADITEAYTRDIAADEPSLVTQLQRLDPRASPIAIPHETSVSTLLGKAFEPQDFLPDYGPRKCTGYPNFSTDFYCPVLLSLSYLVPTADDLLVIGRIKRLLRDVLPSWVDFAVVTSTGFVLDLSPLDVTALT